MNVVYCILYNVHMSLYTVYNVLYSILYSIQCTYVQYTVGCSKCPMIFQTFELRLVTLPNCDK